MASSIKIRDAGSGSNDDILLKDAATVDGTGVSGVTTLKVQGLELVEVQGTDAKSVGLIAWMASMLVSRDVAATLTDGRTSVPVPGTAVKLQVASLPCKWVRVAALTNNTDQVNVGGSGVLATVGFSTGQPLGPGDWITLPVTNANVVYVDARVAGEGVTWTAGA